MIFNKSKIVIIIFCVLIVVGFINFRNKSDTSKTNSEITKIKTSPFPFPQTPLGTSSVITDVDIVEKQLIFKCPEDFISNEEYIQNAAAFLRDYKDKHPNATMEELGGARYQFLKDNNCTKALESWNNQPPLSEIASLFASPGPAAQTGSLISQKDIFIKVADKEYGPYAVSKDDQTKMRTVSYPQRGQITITADELIIFNFYLQGVWGGDKKFSAEDVVNVSLKGQEQNGYTLEYKFEAPDKTTKKPAYFILSDIVYPDQGYGIAYFSKISTVDDDIYSVTFSKQFNGNNKEEIYQNILKWVTDDSEIINRISDLSPDDSWLKFMRGK
jgi:hypothetical protein